MLKRIARWETWIGNVSADILDLTFNEKVYSSLMQIITSNPELPQQSRLYLWLDRAYVLQAAMGIRRQVSRDPRDVSLGRVLGDLLEHRARITPELIYDHARRTRPQVAELRREAAEETLLLLGNVEADVESLNEAAHSIVTAATKRMAHLDQDVADGKPLAMSTYGDLTLCVTMLQELWSAARGSGPAGLVPLTA